MALRAPGLSKKKPFPAFRIAGEYYCHGLALQGAQVVNNCLDLGGSQRTKGWHSSSRYAVLNKTEQSVVRELLNFSFAGDIGRAIAASSVQSVARRATGGKNSLALECAAASSRRRRARLLSVHLLRRDCL
jgi:hypothetical protein